MRLHLHRILQTADVTLGQLVVGNYAFATLEDPWKGNAKNVSCVPCGFYALERHNGHSFKNTWALVGETVSHFAEDGVQRSAIVLHGGDDPGDTQGCILVGMEFNGLTLDGSAEAMRKLRDLLSLGAPHYLTITRQTEGVR